MPVTRDQLTAMLAKTTPAQRAQLAAALGTATRPPVAVGREDRERKVDGLVRLLAGQAGGYNSLHAAYSDVTGKAVFDVDPIRVLRESVGFDASISRATEAVNTITWAQVLGDSVTRRLVAEYQNANLDSWRAVVSSTANVKDFRTQRVVRLGGFGILPTVAEAAPYVELPAPPDEESTYAISKKGGIESFSLESAANDDVRALAAIPVRLGRAAAVTLYRFVWGLVTSNPTVYDGAALFAVAHGNDGTAPLARSAMDAARAAMRAQTAYGDSADLIGAVPKILAVGPALEDLAFEMCISPFALPTSAPDGGATNIPNLWMGTTPVVVDYVTSPTAWWVIADPRSVPTVEVGFLDGRQTPDLIVASDPTVGAAFSADTIQFKIRHAYSGAVLDWRGLARGNV